MSIQYNRWWISLQSTLSFLLMGTEGFSHLGIFQPSLPTAPFLLLTFHTEISHFLLSQTSRYVWIFCYQTKPWLSPVTVSEATCGHCHRSTLEESSRLSQPVSPGLRERHLGREPGLPAQPALRFSPGNDSSAKSACFKSDSFWFQATAFEFWISNTG